MQDAAGAEGGAPSTRTGPARRKPTTGFPVVSLAEAAEILKEAGKYGFEHSVGEFASHMGHSTANSGAFRQRLAALRDWKLVTGRGDRIAMTETARIIALPPDEAKEMAALRTAFESCTIFFKLYDGSQKEIPLERSGIGNRAVHAFGVSPSSVNKFVTSFVESAVAAGLARVGDDDRVTLLEPDVDSLQAVAEASVPTPTAPSTSRPSQATGMATPVVHQSWPIDGGTIEFEIRSERPLPATAYTTVGDVVASLERLSLTLAPAAPEIRSDKTEPGE